MDTNNTTNTCNKCGDTKPVDEFPLRNGKPRLQCRVCTAAAQRERRRRLEDKRGAAISAEHERCPLGGVHHTPDDGEFFKENDRRLKRNAAQKRYRDKKKAEKAKLREAGELVDLPDDAREKVLKWARRYITLKAEKTWLDDVMYKSHEPFKDNYSWGRAAELMYRSDVVRDQLLYLPVWMERYLPANAVATILKDRLGRLDLLLEDRLKIEAKWLKAEQREISARQKRKNEWQAKYDATPSDRHPVERTIRAKHPDGVVHVFTMPLSSDNDLLIPDRAYDDGEDWKEVIRVLSEQDGADYGLMLKAGRGDSEIDAGWRA